MIYEYHLHQNRKKKPTKIQSQLLNCTTMHKEIYSLQFTVINTCSAFHLAANFFGFLDAFVSNQRLLSLADTHIQVASGNCSWPVFGHRGRRLSTGEPGRVRCPCSDVRRQSKKKKTSINTTVTDARSN